MLLLGIVDIIMPIFGSRIAHDVKFDYGRKIKYDM